MKKTGSKQDLRNSSAQAGSPPSPTKRLGLLDRFSSSFRKSSSRLSDQGSEDGNSVSSTRRSSLSPLPSLRRLFQSPSKSKLGASKSTFEAGEVASDSTVKPSYIPLTSKTLAQRFSPWSELAVEEVGKPKTLKEEIADLMLTGKDLSILFDSEIRKELAKELGTEGKLNALIADVAQEIRDGKIEVDSESESAINSLRFIIISGNIDGIGAFADQIATPDIYGYTALDYAKMTGNSEIESEVKRIMLEKPSLAPNETLVEQAKNILREGGDFSLLFTKEAVVDSSQIKKMAATVFKESGSQSLHLAVIAGEVDKIDDLIDQIDKRDQYGYTPLHYAAMMGDAGIEITRQLLLKGANTEVLDANGNSANYYFSSNSKAIQNDGTTNLQGLYLKNFTEGRFSKRLVDLPNRTTPISVATTLAVSAPLEASVSSGLSMISSFFYDNKIPAKWWGMHDDAIEALKSKAEKFVLVHPKLTQEIADLEKLKDITLSIERLLDHIIISKDEGKLAELESAAKKRIEEAKITGNEVLLKSAQSLLKDCEFRRSISGEGKEPGLMRVQKEIEKYVEQLVQAQGVNDLYTKSVLESLRGLEVADFLMIRKNFEDILEKVKDVQKVVLTNLSFLQQIEANGSKEIVALGNYYITKDITSFPAFLEKFKPSGEDLAVLMTSAIKAGKQAIGMILGNSEPFNSPDFSIVYGIKIYSSTNQPAAENVAKLIESIHGKKPLTKDSFSQITNAADLDKLSKFAAACDNKAVEALVLERNAELLKDEAMGILSNLRVTGLSDTDQRMIMSLYLVNFAAIKDKFPQILESKSTTKSVLISQLKIFILERAIQQVLKTGKEVDSISLHILRSLLKAQKAGDSATEERSAEVGQTMEAAISFLEGKEGNLNDFKKNRAAYEEKQFNNSSAVLEYNGKLNELLAQYDETAKEFRVVFEEMKLAVEKSDNEFLKGAFAVSDMKLSEIPTTSEIIKVMTEVEEIMRAEQYKSSPIFGPQLESLKSLRIKALDVTKQHKDLLVKKPRISQPTTTVLFQSELYKSLVSLFGSVEESISQAVKVDHKFSDAEKQDLFLLNKEDHTFKLKQQQKEQQEQQRIEERKAKAKDTPSTDLHEPEKSSQLLLGQESARKM